MAEYRIRSITTTSTFVNSSVITMAVPNFPQLNMHRLVSSSAGWSPVDAIGVLALVTSTANDMCCVEREEKAKRSMP